MSATTNNKRCKGASFPKLFQKYKMGTKTRHFLLCAEMAAFALQQNPKHRARQEDMELTGSKLSKKRRLENSFFFLFFF
ncbi:hypothetical protein XENTR_v10002748 [Xenopus tropicalis]|nr:hypothetical protein XENTR_v10002748 [Xenopus tropicalis]